MDVSMDVSTDVSVIVPVHNGGEFLERCLGALQGSTEARFEIIVVDDASTDDTAERAREMGARVVELPEQSGPARARNLGVSKALGGIVLFVDVDVIVTPGTVQRVSEFFGRNPDVAALFGSYDDEPEAAGFLSQYRNLFHHYHHQTSGSEAFSFWAGCGAVRKTVFDEVGGFDGERYAKPSIEDIEFGWRVRARGGRIILDKGLTVKHLKTWRFLNMLRTDIFQRAIPWSSLIMETGEVPRDLNLKASEKISSVLVALMLLSAFFTALAEGEAFGIPLASGALVLTLALFIVFVSLNLALYGFFMRKRGAGFMLKSIPLHMLYYIYSGVSFVFCWLKYRVCILGPLKRFFGEDNAGAREKD
jgi:glycosyltransferase involved in cell wall biosynthesis